ncbi:MAG: AURKAIP1/COX24 domain-containing protein [Lentisphaeria bacterium]
MKVQVDTYPWATGGIMGNLKKQRRKKIAKHKRRKRLKAMRHKNK